jgi:cytoskeletal protein RodZ
MNELLVILAISVIIIGFLILVGIALWLAAERRRNLAAQSRPAQQRGGQPVMQQPVPQATPTAAPAPADPPAAEGQAGSVPTTGNPPQKEPHASGEYPSAALYDQTILPQPPRRRTRQPPK